MKSNILLIMAIIKNEGWQAYVPVCCRSSEVDSQVNAIQIVNCIEFKFYLKTMKCHNCMASSSS